MHVECLVDLHYEGNNVRAREKALVGGALGEREIAGELRSPQEIAGDVGERSPQELAVGVVARRSCQPLLDAKTLPAPYWMPKMHKIGNRFISAALHSVLADIDQIVFRGLELILRSFANRDGREFSPHRRMCWLIKNSTPIVDILRKGPRISSLGSADFSGLYPSLPIAAVKANLVQFIKDEGRLFKRSGIRITASRKQAFWIHDENIDCPAPASQKKTSRKKDNRKLLWELLHVGERSPQELAVDVVARRSRPVPHAQWCRSSTANTLHAVPYSSTSPKSATRFRGLCGRYLQVIGTHAGIDRAMFLARRYLFQGLRDDPTRSLSEPQEDICMRPRGQTFSGRRGKFPQSRELLFMVYSSSLDY